MPGTHKKSSPLYKGIGKYKKKAKGSRGFKMKSPLRNNEGVKTVIEKKDGKEYLTKSKDGRSTTFTRDTDYKEKGRRWTTKEGGVLITS